MKASVPLTIDMNLGHIKHSHNTDGQKAYAAKVYCGTKSMTKGHK